MTPDDAFLQTILEQPEDDLPRLMYADWLTERGDERGEFIRVQCELARTPPDDFRRSLWEAVSRELLSRHRDAWLGPLRSLAYRWEFSRGFPEEVVSDTSAFLAHATFFLSQVPLRAARLIRAWGKVRELATCPALGQLSALHLTRNSLGDRDVERLAASRHLRNLTVLRLGNNYLGDAAAYALAESQNLGRLTTLNLTHNQISDLGAACLASSPNLPALTVLQLGHNCLSPAGMERLRSSLDHLDSLDLANNAGKRSLPAVSPALSLAD